MVNMVFLTPAWGGDPCRRFVVAFALPWQEKKWLLCLVVLPKVRIFVVLFPPEAVGYLVAGRLYCFINVAQNSLNASFCPQLVPNFC